MQDSFDARMQGQTPATVKPAKSGKGWMILSIVLLVVMIAGGVFAGMIIMKGNRDTNRLSEVENQLKEKEAKIEELEKAKTSAEEKAKEAQAVAIDAAAEELTNLITKNKQYGPSIVLKELKTTSDGKYLYAIAGDTTGQGVYFKEIENGKWTFVNGGHAVSACSEISAEGLEFMKTYGKEYKSYAFCTNEKNEQIDYSK